MKTINKLYKIIKEEVQNFIMENRMLSHQEIINRGGSGNLRRAIEKQIPINKITGLDPEPVDWTDDEGNVHKYEKGVEIKQPIEVTYDSDNDEYLMVNGNHRIKQAKLNGDKYIIAWVEPDNGKVGTINEGDYSGEHQAPYNNGDDKPMHLAGELYGDDIYTINAYKYFTNHRPYDNEAINAIQSAHNKPNKRIKIYRAVPLRGEIKQLKKRIQDIQQTLNYFDQNNGFKFGDKIVKEFGVDYEDKFMNKEITNEQFNLYVYNDIQKELYILEENLKNTNEIKTINDGDWVTITKGYAIQHGKNELNNQYKIISKIVPVKYLYTDANDIQEWGYDSDE